LQKRRSCFASIPSPCVTPLSIAGRLAAHAGGVAVHLIYDGWGRLNTPSSLFDRLRQGSIQTVDYNPLEPGISLPFDINRRDHRKLVVSDDAGVPNASGQKSFCFFFFRKRRLLSYPPPRLFQNPVLPHICRRQPGKRRPMAQSRLQHLTVISPAGAPSGTTEAEDALWRQVRAEAELALAEAPMLAPLFLESIINQPSLDAAVFHRVAARLRNEVVSPALIIGAFQRAAAASHELGAGLRADLVAVLERDPACSRLIEPILYFKGFHALQTHRLTHWLWTNGERDFALYLQSRGSEVFQTDIHPAAVIGRGLFLDHATGLVVGATAVIEDDVSMLQDVTLGGTGKERGDRHPKVRRGALIGAGAKILGNIEVGQGARIAAGSVVLNAVPPRTTVAGIPARVVSVTTPADPSRCMDQCLNGMASYDSFSYAI
jgi:serine O-acetyltransferase